MPQHIGIVACSAEGAGLCYRTICVEGVEHLGPHAHPEVSMHTPSLADTMARIYDGDWQGVADIMLDSAQKLASIGADFLICPDNTIHQAMPYVTPKSPLPWLHIAEVVADEAATRGFRLIALTGTRWLVASDIYPDKLAARGLECVRPEAAEREEINRIIMNELVYGNFRPEGIAYFQQVIRRMKENGCEAVILGCTEIPSSSVMTTRRCRRWTRRRPGAGGIEEGGGREGGGLKAAYGASAPISSFRFAT